MKLARIESKMFLEFIYNYNHYREETGLKINVWRISHGAVPGQAHARQTGQK